MAKKYRVRTQFNYNDKLDTGKEVSTLPSLTVPDESFTIPELIQKHTSGIPINVERQGQFDDDPTHEDHDKQELLQMDLAEKEQIIKQNLQEIGRLKEVVKKQADDKEQSATKERKAEQSEKEAKEKTTEKNTSIQEVEK